MIAVPPRRSRGPDTVILFNGGDSCLCAYHVHSYWTQGQISFSCRLEPPITTVDAFGLRLCVWGGLVCCTYFVFPHVVHDFDDACDDCDDDSAAFCIGFAGSQVVLSKVKLVQNR